MQCYGIFTMKEKYVALTSDLSIWAKFQNSHISHKYKEKHIFNDDSYYSFKSSVLYLILRNELWKLHIHISVQRFNTIIEKRKKS